MNRTDESARLRLADAMDGRRKELRLRWEEIAERAEISGTHLRRIRRGESGFTDLVEVRLEEALLWSPGSIKAVLGGGEPTPAASRLEILAHTTQTGHGLDTPTVKELQAEIDALMGGLPEWRRRRLEKLIAEEEAELEHLRRSRLKRWKEVIEDQRGQSDLS
ncbi:hypothetical protein ACFYY8_31150 [Streptosporangium sp. NPDC001559]|uniref:hypothetical protein n=1 Tax=Streptosporangium sp. NPDC001559 TaxID=3366187 RepID=UPI0036E8AC12